MAEEEKKEGIVEEVEDKFKEEQAPHKVNKWIYFLLAFFLGSFGAHKFYANKVAFGILYLCFCWTFIPGLVGLVEGLIALTKKPDSNGDIEV